MTVEVAGEDLQAYLRQDTNMSRKLRDEVNAFFILA